MRCMHGVCNIKDKYGNGYQSNRIWVPLIWIFSAVPCLLNIKSFIHYNPFKGWITILGPSNNLNVIQFNDYDSCLLHHYSLHNPSFSILWGVVSISHELIQLLSVTACLHLSIFRFCSFFLPQHHMTFVICPYFLNVTIAAIICHCLDLRIGKGRRELKTKGYACQPAQNISSLPLPTYSRYLMPNTPHIYKYIY